MTMTAAGLAEMPAVVVAECITPRKRVRTASCAVPGRSCQMVFCAMAMFVVWVAGSNTAYVWCIGSWCLHRLVGFPAGSAEVLFINGLHEGIRGAVVHCWQALVGKGLACGAHLQQVLTLLHGYSPNWNLGSSCLYLTIL